MIRHTLRRMRGNQSIEQGRQAAKPLKKSPQKPGRADMTTVRFFFPFFSWGCGSSVVNAGREAKNVACTAAFVCKYFGKISRGENGDAEYGMNSTLGGSWRQYVIESTTGCHLTSHINAMNPMTSWYLSSTPPSIILATNLHCYYSGYPTTRPCILQICHSDKPNTGLKLCLS